MTEISPLDLKEGITYRIVHRDGQIEEHVGVLRVACGSAVCEAIRE